MLEVEREGWAPEEHKLTDKSLSFKRKQILRTYWLLVGWWLVASPKDKVSIDHDIYVDLINYILK